ncbi:TMEM175 family protein [Humibacter antri]
MTAESEESSRPSARGRKARKYRTDRMIGLSDGVFAFAITLLVLDLVVPTLTGGDVVVKILGEWPTFLAYVISFATIGAVWLAHSAITDHLVHTDSNFVRFNLLVLLFVSFMPYPTKFLSAFIETDHPEQFAVSLYGGSVLVLTGLLWTLWWYARRAGLLDPDAPEEDHVIFTQRLIPGLVAYVVLIIVGWFVPVVALVGYAIIAVFFIFPFRLRRLRRPSGEARPSGE